MDDREFIIERLDKIKEKVPTYSGVICRRCMGGLILASNGSLANNFAEFGDVVYPFNSKSGKLTVDDIISCVKGMFDMLKRNGVVAHEAVVMLQYKKHKGMVLKYGLNSDGTEGIYIIGELEPCKNDSFVKIL